MASSTAAPSSTAPPTISPALHGPWPSSPAASMPGATRENAHAASLTPAPNPNIPSCTFSDSACENMTGTVPSAVAPAASRPPASASATCGARGARYCQRECAPRQATSTASVQTLMLVACGRIRWRLKVFMQGFRWRRERRASALGGLVTARHFVPVDHVEERADVFRTAILVLQVVRVFPHIQAQHRRVAVHQRAVLVGRTLHHQFAFRRDAEPGPAAAEACQRGFGESVAERVH